jgi:hypothetical protein
VVEWFEFDPGDAGPIETLVAGLPVDDGLLVVAVEAGPIEHTGLVSRMLGREPHRGARVNVYKFSGAHEPDHYIVMIKHEADRRLDTFITVPPWASVDEGKINAVVSAPLTVPANDVAMLVRDVLLALAPESAVWRIVEDQAVHVNVGGTEFA